MFTCDAVNVFVFTKTMMLIAFYMHLDLLTLDYIFSNIDKSIGGTTIYKFNKESIRCFDKT